MKLHEHVQRLVDRANRLHEDTEDDLLSILFGPQEIKHDVVTVKEPTDTYHAEICQSCHGSGRLQDHMKRWRFCTECEGYGVVRFINNFWVKNPLQPPKGVPFFRSPAQGGNTKSYVTDLLKNKIFLEYPAARRGPTLDQYHKLMASK
jgi:hypothetical protein